MSNQIRVVALALIKREDGKILVERGEDTIKGDYFYRPLGGGVKFGETGVKAIIRELQEEIGKDIIVDSQSFVDENIFEYEGEVGHQIMFVYNCSFENIDDYKIYEFPRLDGYIGTSAKWKLPQEIKDEGVNIYPEALIDIT